MDDGRNDEQYYKNKLTSEQYHVLRESGTEPPYTGKFYNNYESGNYECAACGAMLFSSDTKFDSGTGWPSFEQPMSLEHIELRQDDSHNMIRTEVICKTCKSHLGHFFEGVAGSKTGKDYCINSCALNFTPKKTV